jgi:hypothetical protein
MIGDEFTPPSGVRLRVSDRSPVMEQAAYSVSVRRRIADDRMELEILPNGPDDMLYDFEFLVPEPLWSRLGGEVILLDREGKPLDVNVRASQRLLVMDGAVPGAFVIAGRP